MSSIFGRCPICLQNEKLNNEDWLPAWARRTIVQHAKWKGEQPPRQLTLIGARCNSRMGAIFENPAALVMRPMITGDSAIFSAEDQAVISMWLQKSSLIRAIATEGGRARISDEETREELRMALMMMMEIRAPLPLASVRVGCFDPGVLIGDYSAETGPGDSDFGLPASHTDFFFTCFTHAYGLVAEVVFGFEERIESFISATRPDDRLIRVHPCEAAELIWPPSRRLSWETYKALCVAWGHSPDDYLPGMRRVDGKWAPPERKAP